MAEAAKEGGVDDREVCCYLFLHVYARLQAWELPPIAFACLGGGRALVVAVDFVMCFYTMVYGPPCAALRVVAGRLGGAASSRCAAVADGHARLKHLLHPPWRQHWRAEHVSWACIS